MPLRQRPRTLPATAAATTSAVTPNLFGSAFGMAGLALAWEAATPGLGLPRWPTDLLWLLAAGVYAGTLVAYVVDVVRRRRLRADLDSPVLGPFTSLAAIPAIMLGGALADHAETAGTAIALAAIAVTVGLGGWLTGGWILRPAELAQWHPGYFLPTVAGGLVASAVCAQLGMEPLGRLLLGYGVVCWLVLGSILLLRLFTQPALPSALLPTMAIEVAPPFVASNAWFALNGARSDAVALGLAGYGVLMALVQVRLVAAYRTAPFGPAFWSFSFSYAAVATTALTWLSLEAPSGQRLWQWLVLGVLTLGYVALATRTAVALRGGTYLPRVPAVPAPRSTAGAGRA
ncbi:SLAC1 family transporter [Motilibacter aurantiacus]|uniref:SLAC1 family transporter n=1 Tax=Motilibacter aurantiacus TaxID=2714955 RepID=UPI00140C5FE3|nr:TDT family transporter [Motilibacter aurantiacus]NHC47441.1 TDT family transporter [Motilibacter aurantiacus]